MSRGNKHPTLVHRDRATSEEWDRTSFADLPSFPDWESDEPTLCHSCGEELSDIGLGCYCVAIGMFRGRRCWPTR